MPTIKKYSGLDGPNAIYSASRKLASRQLKNMKSPAIDNGETSQPSPPIPSSSSMSDDAGLIPQLLQNVSDINGLMTSLKLVGGKSARDLPEGYIEEDDEEDGDYPKKRPRGEGRPSLSRKKRGGSRNTEAIKKLEDKIRREQKRVEDNERKIREYSKLSPTTNEEKDYIRQEIQDAKDEIKRGKGNIKNHLKKIEKLQREDDEEQQNLPPAPAPPQEDEEEDQGFPGGAEGPIDRDEIPPPVAPIINPQDDDLEDNEGDAYLDMSQFDFSKVGKSTLLVILNQLKSLVKRGDILLKKIVSSGIAAGEGDLDTLTDELSDLISSKKFLLNHILQISRKGKEIAEYLHSILTKAVGKFIENLKTYIKRYAQLNREQINSIQDDDAVEVGAGMRSAAYDGRSSSHSVSSVGRPVVLSSLVRRISGYDKKYLL